MPCWSRGSIDAPGWDAIKENVGTTVNPLEGLISRGPDGGIKVDWPRATKFWGGVAKGTVEAAGVERSKALNLLKEAWDEAKAANMDPDLTLAERLKRGFGADLTALEVFGHARERCTSCRASRGSCRRADRGRQRRGGLGEATRMLLPVVRPLHRRGLGRRSAAALERSAAKNTLRAIGAEPAVKGQLLNPDTIHSLTPPEALPAPIQALMETRGLKDTKQLVRWLHTHPDDLDLFHAMGGKLSDLIGREVQVLPDVKLEAVRKQLGAGTHSMLAKRAGELLEDFKGRLARLKQGPFAEEPIEPAPVIAELEGKVPEVKLPAAKPAGLPPNWEQMSGPERQA